MLLDIINPAKVKRGAVYALYMAVVLIFQNSIFSGVSLLGVKCMFLPAAAVAVGLFEGGVWGCVFGLFLGIFGDMALQENTVLFTVLFPVLGFVSGFLTKFFVNKRFFAYFFIAVFALALTALCQMSGLYLFRGADIYDLLGTGALQVLWSLPFAVALYFPCRSLQSKDTGTNRG